MNGPPGSWNRIPRVRHRHVFDWPGGASELPDTKGMLLPYGNGRSYGDVCLNADGTLIRTGQANRVIGFDRESGRLVCEAGILLKDILELVVPHGWFLPVTPGTRFVSVGGAIANDVHGKNHYTHGSFGHSLLRFELLRSDGTRMVCSPDENAPWFRATVGGLGLTGLITWAEIQLMPIDNRFMLTETRRFGDLDAFWALNAEAETRWPYTVAWIDCLAAQRHRGRGIYLSARHAPAQSAAPDWRERPLRFPLDPPVSLVNRLSLRIFNTLYYHRRLPAGPRLTHYAPYFYPLDRILEWNRIYGRKGFYQYQCVIPPDSAQYGIRNLLEIIARHGTGSFLAVLKTFGSRPSLGMLSFPRAGATLALDFPDEGSRTLRLFAELDAVVRETNGAIYPAKDARMPGNLFRAGYPAWRTFAEHIDPRFSSSFWRRVTE